MLFFQKTQLSRFSHTFALKLTSNISVNMTSHLIRGDTVFVKIKNIISRFNTNNLSQEGTVKMSTKNDFSVVTMFDNFLSEKNFETHRLQQEL